MAWVSASKVNRSQLGENTLSIMLTGRGNPGSIVFGSKAISKHGLWEYKHATVKNWDSNPRLIGIQLSKESSPGYRMGYALTKKGSMISIGCEPAIRMAKTTVGRYQFKVEAKGFFVVDTSVKVDEKCQ